MYEKEMSDDEIFSLFLQNAGDRYVLVGDEEDAKAGAAAVYDTETRFITYASEGDDSKFRETVMGMARRGARIMTRDAVSGL